MAFEGEVDRSKVLSWNAGKELEKKETPATHTQSKSVWWSREDTQPIKKRKAVKIKD